MKDEHIGPDWMNGGTMVFIDRVLRIVIPIILAFMTYVLTGINGQLSALSARQQVHETILAARGERLATIETRINSFESVLTRLDGQLEKHNVIMQSFIEKYAKPSRER